MIPLVIADIKNCFRSVQQEGLEKVLELPKAIVSNFLLIRSTVKLLPKPLTTSIGVFGGTALSGLPQGSCASGKITGILLGPTLKSITSTDRIVLHGDDILIAASNQSEAKAFKSALKKALETHTYGPFRLKHSSIHTINKGFDFLKYHHRLTWEGKTHLRPSMRCYTRMKRKVQAKITKPEIMLREHLQVYIQRWMKSFPLWKRTYLSLLLLEMSIAEQLGKFVHLLPEWRKQNKVKVDTKNEAKSIPKNKIKSKIIKLKFSIKPPGTGSNA